jgi:hypothetical protein
MRALACAMVVVLAATAPSARAAGDAACAPAQFAATPSVDGGSEAPVLRGSVLAYPLVTGNREPELVLAQRTIERNWGPSDDSTYREVAVPGWKSEGGAMAMSFVLPGTGQLYAKDRSGYLYLLVEVVGIYQTVALKNTGRDWDKKARAYAGDPNDSTSNWAFETYEKHSGQSADALRALYRADPGLFYAEIADLDALQYGWVDYPTTDVTREQYSEWRENSQSRFKRSRYWRAALWTNHLVSAFDAMRVARKVNIPLQRNLELKLKSGWNARGPNLTAAVEGRF